MPFFDPDTNMLFLAGKVYMVFYTRWKMHETPYVHDLKKVKLNIVSCDEGPHLDHLELIIIIAISSSVN